MMLVVGLTGGIATGKSTVGKMFARLGARRIDTDRLAREVVEPGQPGLAAVVARFGGEVLTADGRLDRKALGKIVFHDAGLRKELEAILHPLIGELMREELRAAEAAGDCIVLVEVPLLYETGFQRETDRVIVVTADRETQLARLKERDGLDEAEAMRRIAAQMPLSEKAARADYVIDNSGSLAETEKQVEAVWQILQRECDNG
jgi:dephospho-CoA kinase